MAKRLLRWVLFTTVIGGGVLLLSGGWTDRFLWAYTGLWAMLGFYALMSIDDDLARERFTPPAPGADRLSLRAIRLIALAHLVVGALDGGRWQVAPVPDWLRASALVVMSASAVLVFRSMLTNRFFSAVVRIQSDRGHHVVDVGPYAIVRHPGYAGMIPVMPASALALGSWLSFAIALVYSALIFRRVLFEDAFLQKNLTGYADYARRVPYRLIPGTF